MDKLLVIINPKAGTDKVKSISDTILEYLENDFDLDIQLTKYAGHATELATNAVQNGYFGVIAVGGDGSINEVAQALVGTKTALGIIPKGSGNGLARSLHIDLNVQSALQTIKKKHLEAIDVGLVNEEHYFLSNLGVGFDVKISKEFKKATLRGFLGYSKLVTQHLFQYHPKKYKLTIDGSVHHVKAFLLNVANAEQFGFNFKIAPHADVQDGIFDIIAVKKFPILESGLLLLDAFVGNLHKNKFVHKWNGTSISIFHNPLPYYQVDGDLIKNKLANEVNIKMLPKAIYVFKP